MCFCDFVTNRNDHRFVSHLGPGMNLKKILHSSLCNFFLSCGIFLVWWQVCLMCGYRSKYTTNFTHLFTP